MSRRLITVADYGYAAVSQASPADLLTLRALPGIELGAADIVPV